jgi:hypothetical protein
MEQAAIVIGVRVVGGERDRLARHAANFSV